MEAALAAAVQQADRVEEVETQPGWGEGCSL
jgi:hypothetical protein